MIMPRHMPPDAYFDDPAMKLDHLDCLEELSRKMSSETLICVFDWIMRGKVKQRSLRFHLVALCVCPQLFPCKHPSAYWCAREHGVSRQWASQLHQQFSNELGDRIRFRGQRFASKINVSKKQRGLLKKTKHNTDPTEPRIDF